MDDAHDNSRAGKDPEPSADAALPDDISESTEKPISPGEAASYIHDLAFELKELAKAARLTYLARLLELAVEESAMQRRGRL